MTTVARNQGVLTMSACSVGSELLHKLLRAVADLEHENQMDTARAISFAATAAYWETICASHGGTGEWPLHPLPMDVRIPDLSSDVLDLAASVGLMCAYSDTLAASHTIGSLYTKMMSSEERSELGAYYTPPALCQRLLDMATDAGTDWRTNRVFDPSCGAGAFLILGARRMMEHLADLEAETFLESVEQRLSGLDVDPFAAWLSQVFLETLMIDRCSAAGRPLKRLAMAGDALEQQPDGQGFDLVIGNPPYGRIKLRDDLRAKFERSLYGHANRYGIFTDLAVRLVNPDGVVAYVTPTSFLSGAYFKSLRRLLGAEAPPVSIDFVTDRKGVFDDVLQETVLTVYQRGGQRLPRQATFTSLQPDGSAKTAFAGTFSLPDDPEQPWIVPRSSDLSILVERITGLPHRLSDYGYEVKTGPLVWNRHKADLRERQEEGCRPLIWAEAVRADGMFEFRAEKLTHQPYFEPRPDQEWLITRTPCVLLRRTTSKEQERRLMAAELPAEFVAKHNGVVVENHLNIIKPRNDDAKVSAAALSALLNSDIVDRIFRCVNGSVAVSAYELEALPLPPPGRLAQLEGVVKERSDRKEIEREVELLYQGESH